MLVSLHQGFVLAESSMEVSRHFSPKENSHFRLSNMPNGTLRSDVLWKHLKHLLVRFT